MSIQECGMCKYYDVEWNYQTLDYNEPCCYCKGGNLEAKESKFEPKDSSNEPEPLTINGYQRAALRTENGTAQIFPRIFNAALGLSGEAGEVADLVKKWAFQGHPKDHDKVAEELGDICWYIAVAADAIGFTLEEIMKRNVEKLKGRYPNGFETERSVNRG